MPVFGAQWRRGRSAPDDRDASLDGDLYGELDGPLVAEPPHPISWNLPTAEEAEVKWIEMNRWVHWLRRTYRLSVSVVPPLWHRHSEPLWELSALHLHRLSAYDPEQHGSAPFGWHRDFADALQRLRDWAASSGTRLERDRPATRGRGRVLCSTAAKLNFSPRCSLCDAHTNTGSRAELPTA